ncbi:MAG: CPBP family intramembrane metalloprotease [Sedimentisphaerales bacterium]|nr:CPBP family intramembrane metalloprotease [Sedimentisphaerales bacterium]
MAECPRAFPARAEPHISPQEVVLVTTTVLALLMVCHRLSGRWVWSLSSLVLVLGAVVPIMARGRHLATLGLQWGQVKSGIALLVAAAAGMLVLGFLAVAAFKHMAIQPPLAASIPPDGRLVWVLFQFVYVALPEELFFRGYVLGSSLCLLTTSGKMSPLVAGLTAVLLSAAVFALSHVLILGHAASLLTFFPALLFGWLFVRMGSLVPAVVLHGVANIGCAMMVGVSV